MTEADKLSAGVQRIIDAHLDAIETSLRASGVGRSERHGIVENVENQINEMLDARVAGTPTEEDVRALIARLDAPESYVEAMDLPVEEPAPIARVASQEHLPRISKCAVFGAVWSLPLLGLPLIWLLLRASASSTVLSWLSLLTIPLLLLAVSAPIGTTVMGVVSLSQIRRSRGTLYGRRLALADALAYPVLAALPVCAGLAGTILAFLIGLLSGISFGHDWEEVLTHPLVWSLGIMFWVVVAGAIIWWIVRHVGERATDE